jgi:hypothetical protein
MMLDQHLSLREVASRLEDTDRFQSTISWGRLELLRLLQNNEIRAFFRFPSQAEPDIYISQEFWKDVSGGVFQTELDVGEAERRLPG